MRDKAPRYTRTAVWLHWITAALLIFMLILGEDLIRVPRGGSLAGRQPSAHASFGFLVLLLALARLSWRWVHPAPDLSTSMASWERALSHLTHWAFYALLIAIPLLGLLALAPYGVDRSDVEQVTFFRLFSLAFMPNAGGWTLEAHEIASNIAKILVVLHVLGALKHQFWNRDGLLWRMSPRR
jgi:cytochrome b561